MSNVLNRVTKEIRYSVNTPDYPVESWIINPDMSNVTGVPMKYWKIVGDEILEMNEDEKFEVDYLSNRIKTIVIYNPADVLVPNRVTFIFPDMDITPFEGKDMVGVGPDFMTGCDMKYYVYNFDSNAIVEMSEEEKAIIDAYVMPENKKRVEITVEIFLGVSSQEQALRILDAIDTNGSFIYALDDHNYVLARYRLYKMLAEGLITLEDVFLADSKVPASILKDI